MTWRSIATDPPPKDGTAVFVICADAAPMIVHWGNHPAAADGPTWLYGYKEDWPSKSCTKFQMRAAAEMLGWVEKPTHWLPLDTLPPPPQETGIVQKLHSGFGADDRHRGGLEGCGVVEVIPSKSEVTLAPESSRAGIPIIRADGIHDDTAGLNAFFAAQPVRLELLYQRFTMERPFEWTIRYATFRITDKIVIRKAHNCRFDQCRFDFESEAPTAEVLDIVLSEDGDRIEWNHTIINATLPKERKLLPELMEWHLTQPTIIWPLQFLMHGTMKGKAGDKPREFSLAAWEYKITIENEGVAA